MIPKEEERESPVFGSISALSFFALSDEEGLGAIRVPVTLD
ncbi:hypothetical protein M20_2060 [Lactococcus lactis subsp. lactis]|uniref:Uncharacterized protein n=1 Tax=Lactococcus lactis subsp. lactis TaxID=1360 RepID=A0A0V8E0L9_LACLL|nr:hypothetical protein M20_2060 [Lactococcus lactis subsp. lactis]